MTTYAAVKTSDQVVSSSTTLVNETDLAVPIGVNEGWVIHWSLAVSFNPLSTASHGIALAVTVPASAFLQVQVIGDGTQNGSGLPTPATGSTNGSGTRMDLVPTFSNSGVFTVSAAVTGSATPGNATLQFADNTGHADHIVTIYKGSGVSAIRR